MARHHEDFSNVQIVHKFAGRVIPNIDFKGEIFLTPNISKMVQL